MRAIALPNHERLHGVGPERQAHCFGKPGIAVQAGPNGHKLGSSRESAMAAGLCPTLEHKNPIPSSPTNVASFANDES